MPIISILLPTYKNPPYLMRAIRSVTTQSFSDWELIIVDDGLIHERRQAVDVLAKDDPRIILVSNEGNLGIQKSLNKGLSIARGMYIARIDDDDAWTDTLKLAEQVQFLDDHHDHVLVGTGAIVVDAEAKELTKYLLPKDDTLIRKQMLRKNCFVHSSVLYRRTEAQEVGGYSLEKTALHIEDYDLWLRLGSVGKIHNISSYAVSFTMHPDSLSAKNKRDQFRRSIELIRKFKKAYPNYFTSMCIAYARLFAYTFFNFLPRSFKNKIFQLYKTY